MLNKDEAREYVNEWMGKYDVVLSKAAYDALVLRVMKIQELLVQPLVGLENV